MDPFVDIHCHAPPLGDNVRALLCVSPEAIDGARSPTTLACCAVHPWDSTQPDADMKFGIVAEAAHSQRISALGETGIDRFRRDIPIDSQIGMFRRHAVLAEETNQPLVIHSVRANADVLAERSRVRASVPWIIHGLHASPDEACKIVSKGVLVSMGLRELERPGAKELLRRIPSGRWLLESDDSGLPIEDVYRLAAKVLGCGLDDLVSPLFASWVSLFGV